MHRALLLCLAALAEGPSLTCVQEQGRASLWLDRPSGAPLSVKLSETLTLLIRVEGETPLVVELNKGISTESWHLEAVGKPHSTPLDGGKRTRWEQMFLAKAWQTGKLPLQMPSLQFSENDGPDQEIEWLPLQLMVTTRVAKVDIREARDRSGIEELPAVPPPAPHWWPWSLPVVFVVVLCAILRWRRPRRPAVEPSAHDVASRELAKLGRLPLDGTEEVKHFFRQLSELLRRYIENRLGVPATRQTTPEFFLALAQMSPLEAAEQEMLSELLRRCDLGKFANRTSASEECAELIATAREFVERMESRQAAGNKSSEQASEISSAT